jgi:hypothetical protein
MAGLTDFIHEHCLVIVFSLIVIIVLVIIIFSMGIGVAAKSESFKVPWGRAENLFSGDLTPSQQALYNRLSRVDPVKTPMRRAEYFSNTYETPALTRKLFS